MRPSIHFFLAALAALSTVHGQPVHTIPGEYIIQMKGTSIPNLQKKLSEALKAGGMPSCTVKPKIVEINTHTWAFLRCQEKKASSAALASLPSENVATVLANTKNVEVERVDPNVKTYSAMLPKQAWGSEEVDGRRNNRRCQRKSQLGRGVDVYILDTGCTPNPGGLCTSDIPSEPFCLDLHGHGTHVGGTATGRKYGVAPRARPHCVKVGDKDLAVPYDSVILGLARVYEHNKQSKRTGVVNMSFAGAKLEAVNMALKLVAGPKLLISVAAGNFEVDACLISPASATVGNPFVFTVVAHDRQGVAASFTNFGDCTDMSAPGVNVRSDNGKFSGTSMAAPHVAGAMAILLAEGKEVSQKTLTGSRIIPRISKPALQIDC